MTSNFNPNDISAALYDLANAPLKNEEVLVAESDLIKSMIKPTASILDIGCGTGRHMIPLLQSGYSVVGIDSSEKMLEVLKKKKPSANVQLNSVFDLEIKQKFDLVILMWNTFNEIALTKTQAVELIKKIKLALNPDGKILINIDDASQLDLPNMNFETEYEKEGLIYSQIWKVVDFDKSTNTTVSLETIQVLDLTSKNVLHQTETKITQRWWGREELKNLLEAQNFKVSFTSLSLNAELYCVAR